MTPSRPLLLLGCFIVTLALYPACATGGYAGTQIVIGSNGDVNLEIMTTVAAEPLFTNPPTRNRTVFRFLGLDALIGYNFKTNKLVGGLGNVINISHRPALALSGLESRIGTRFRFGGGHGFQGGFFAHYAHAVVVYADRDFPTCTAQRSESQYWLGFAGGAEILWTKRGNNRGAAIGANFLVGTAYGRDRVSRGGVMLSACGEPAE
jgi:hypothetical protein